MNLRIRRLVLAAAAVTLVSISGAGLAQSTGKESAHDAQADLPPPTGQPMPDHDHTQMPGMMQQHGAQTMDMHDRHVAQVRGANLAMPGQDAFGAIQEIVAKLDADPKTDWSKVNLEALRQHLIDMNEVVLRADATARPIDGGLEIAVTGSGRTLAAIQAMVPEHAREINGLNGWSARTEPMESGVLLFVTAIDAKEVQHIRGLGFIGILVSGAHHQAHHLAMAKSEFSHVH